MVPDYPALGSIGVVKTYGNRFDRFVGRAIRYVTATENLYHRYADASVNHAVVFVGTPAGFTKPMLVQAAPGGANWAPWDSYGDRVIWIDNPNCLTDKGMFAPLNLSVSDRAHIVEHAIDCAIKKIGYNYLDFVAIALAQQRFHQLVHYRNEDNSKLVQWILARLSRPDRMICSQLVDYCYMRAGIPLFLDNRPQGLVSPEDLYSLRHVSV